MMTIEGVITGGGRATTKCLKLVQTPSAQYLENGSTTFNFAYTDPFSFVIWFKIDVSAPTIVVFLTNQFNSGLPPDRGYSLYLESLAPRMIYGEDFTPGNFDRWTFGPAVSAGAWHHLVVTRSAANAIVAYVDGASVTVVQNDSTASVLRVGNDPLRVGNDSISTAGVVGYLDELAIYGRVLSAGDVTALYNSGHVIDYTTAISTAGLLGYWRMGDEAGDSDSGMNGVPPVGSLGLTGTNLSHSIVNRT